MPAQIVPLKKRPRYRKRAVPKVSKNVKRYVNSHISRAISTRQEHKYLSVSNSSVSMPAASYVTSISDISTGTTDSQRVGDAVRLGTLRINFSILKNSSASSTLARVVIFQWADSDQPGAPTGSDIFTNYGTYPAVTTLRHDPLRSKTLRVMADKVYVLDDTDPLVYQSLVLKPASKKLQYDSGGPSGTNKIFMCLLSDQITYGPAMTYMTKLNFTDS